MTKGVFSLRNRLRRRALPAAMASTKPSRCMATTATAPPMGLKNAPARRM